MFPGRRFYAARRALPAYRRAAPFVRRVYASPRTAGLFRRRSVYRRRTPFKRARTVRRAPMRRRRLGGILPPYFRRPPFRSARTPYGRAVPLPPRYHQGEGEYGSYEHVVTPPRRRRPPNDESSPYEARGPHGTPPLAQSSRQLFKPAYEGDTATRRMGRMFREKIANFVDAAGETVAVAARQRASARLRAQANPYLADFAADTLADGVRAGTKRVSDWVRPAYPWRDTSTATATPQQLTPSIFSFLLFLSVRILTSSSPCARHYGTWGLQGEDELHSWCRVATSSLFRWSLNYGYSS
jgi:hypothetical protein